MPGWPRAQPEQLPRGARRPTLLAFRSRTLLMRPPERAPAPPAPRAAAAARRRHRRCRRCHGAPRAQAAAWPAGARYAPSRHPGGRAPQAPLQSQTQGACGRGGGAGTAMMAGHKPGRMKAERCCAAQHALGLHGAAARAGAGFKPALPLHARAPGAPAPAPPAPAPAATHGSTLQLGLSLSHAGTSTRLGSSPATAL
jgi:hypothetical protein